MAQAPSTFVVTGYNMQQVPTDLVTVMPRGGVQASMNQTLGLNAPVTGTITAGTTQTIAGATQLYTGYNFLTVCANTGDAVKLPAVYATPGQAVHLFNQGTKNASVFPYESTVTKIDGGTAGAAVTLTAGANATFVQDTASTWTSELGGAKSA